MCCGSIPLIAVRLIINNLIMADSNLCIKLRVKLVFTFSIGKREISNTNADMSSRTANWISYIGRSMILLEIEITTSRCYIYCYMNN